MIARWWRDLQVHAIGTRRWVVALIGTSVLGGLTEAAALLLALRVALGLSTDGLDSRVAMPVWNASFAPGPAIAIAALCAIASLVAHFAIAWQSAQLELDGLGQLPRSCDREFRRRGLVDPSPPARRAPCKRPSAISA